MLPGTKGKTMNELEQNKVISICIRAAYADGSQSEAERAQVNKIAEGFHQNPALTTAYQEALDQNVTLSQAVQGLQSPEARALAYEMAACVCNADGLTTEDEQRFLQNLRTELHLDSQTADRIGAQVEQLAQAATVQAPPMLSDVADQDKDAMILDYAILTGAFELLPQSIATMAIIPIQIRMVYRIGQQYGFELSRGHIQDFLATVGVGLTSQMVEKYARKLVGSVTRTIGGKLMGGLGGTATGSALAFGTTYALGQVAKQYYAAGRSLDATQLRQVFSSMLNEGSALQQRYASQIMERSRQINVGNLLPLVRES